jgi:protein SCO1/2
MAPLLGVPRPPRTPPNRFRAARYCRLPVAALLLCATLLAIGPPAAGAGAPSGPFAFAAVDQLGRPFSSASLAGAPYAIFFGFTRCPDVCPTTLVEMSNRLAELGEDGNRLKVLFVTVDVEHDTPERLGAFLSAFDRRIIGLTGSADEIKAIAELWGAFYYRLEDGDVTHSAYVYLMDRQHHRAGTLTFQEPEEEQLAKLRRLLARD